MRTRIHRMLAVGALCVVAPCGVACDDPPPPADAPPALGPCASIDGPCLELGAGSDVIPVSDESSIELVHGPQGGWHVELGVRLRGIDPEGTVLTYEARREDDGEALCSVRYGITPRRLIASGGYLLRANDLVVFDIASDDAVRDRHITFEVSVEDALGAALASDVRTLRVVDDAP